MPINWPQFIEIINTHQRFILTSHVRPDCDALGSELGMALVLEALGKDVTIVNPHPTPPNLAFIDPTSRIQVLGEHVQPHLAGHADREQHVAGDERCRAWAVSVSVQEALVFIRDAATPQQGQAAQAEQRQ